MKLSEPISPLLWLVFRCAATSLPLGLVVALSGCETQPQRIAHQDHELVMDGFLEERADTTERQKMLARLPEDQLVRQSDGDTALYVYADPTVCNCIYVGTQRAFDNYKVARQLVVLYPYDGANWNWTAWGPRPEGHGVEQTTVSGSSQ
jgi:hypothetical protein